MSVKCHEKTRCFTSVPHVTKFQTNITDGTTLWMKKLRLTCHSFNLKYSSQRRVGGLVPASNATRSERIMRAFFHGGLMMSHIEWTIRRWSLPGGSGSLRGNGFGGFVSSLALPAAAFASWISQSEQFSPTLKQWSQQTVC